MNDKNSITINTNIKTFPFTDSQLEKFRNELNKAGGFDELMFEKKAFVRKMEMKFIPQYHDIEQYKEKYLTGEYESLRPFYETDMPYVFWSLFYETLRRWERKNK